MDNEASDIASTFGREFCLSLAGIVQSTGQDAFEVYRTVFRDEPDLEALRQITSEQLTDLRDASREWFETELIQTAHLEAAVRETLWHWGD